MGAWGIGVFENDAACDWIFDLTEDDKDIDFVIITLNKAAKYHDSDFDYILEEPTGSEVLAAAEIVAALVGNKNPDLSDQILDWLNNKTVSSNNNLKSIARKAIEVVRNKSELKELWEKSDEFEEWVSIITELQQRLI